MSGEAIPYHAVIRSARRNGWLLAVFCCLSIPFSWDDPVALLAIFAGLFAGIQEIRFGPQLRSARASPAKLLRSLGWAEAVFASLLGVYFAVKFVRLLSGQNVEGMSPEDAAVMESEAPGLLASFQHLSLLFLAPIAIVVVGWQAWVSFRFFRLSRKAGQTPYVSEIVIQLTAEERRRVDDLIATAGISETEALRRVLAAGPSSTPPPLI